MKKAVILLGAGAPICWGSPSCSRIEEAMFASQEFLIVGENKSLAEYIKEQIIEYTGCGNNQVNFEHIINTLEFLIDYEYERISSVNPKFVGTRPIWVEINNAKWEKIKNFRMQSINEETCYVFNNAKRGDTPQQLQKENVTRAYLIDALKHYLSIINTQISGYDHNGNALHEKHKQLNNEILDFYSGLKDNGYCVRFYTTNYDSFFPRILEKVHPIYNGFDDNGTFPNIRKICTEYHLDCYYNLHGSVYWDNDTDVENYEYAFKFNKDIPTTYSYSHSDYTNPAESTFIFNIVTGFSKLQKTSVEPIRSMFNSFANDCMQADLFGTIGYSYADVHINKVIKHCKRISAAKFFHITFTDNFKGTSEFIDMQKITLNNKEINALELKENYHKTPDNMNYIFVKGFDEFLLNKRWKEMI
jgi:hypothetical protein